MNKKLPQFKINLRANNQVTITRQNVIPKRKRTDKLPKIAVLTKEQITSFVDNYADRNNLETQYSINLKHRYIKPCRQNFLPVPLDLIVRFQQAKSDTTSPEKTTLPIQKKGYGISPTIKYFSNKSGQKIRECGAIIDKLCEGDVSKCRVVTLTLPANSHEAFKAISDWSGYAINRLFQVIRHSEYENIHWFFVTEYQKRGAIHYHICLFHADKAVSRELGNQIVSKWRDVLCDISEKASINLLYSRAFGRDCKLSEMQSINQEMQKGCGAYFSKYASKNSGKDSNSIESINARKYPVSSFWGRDRELAKMCEADSFKYKFDGIYDSESISLREEAIEVLSHLEIVSCRSFSFKKEIEVQKGMKESILTICEGESEVFYLSPSSYQKALLHFRFLYKDEASTKVSEYSKVSQSFCPELLVVEETF
jgi:hypothetical protein